MMSRLQPSFLLVIANLFVPALWSGGFASAQDADAKARNPILWADVPDLSIIRVGDTYYMSSTVMHMSPGVPIMKSKDLVNWEMVSYAYDTLGDNDALNLMNGKSAYGEGSWASSLRYFDGTYYVSTFAHTTGKTHVYRTKDIEKGPWTESAFAPALHDHSLLFDDGRVYMVTGSHNIRVVELTADVSAVKPGGLDQVIVPNASLTASPNVGLPAEGSQIFKINGKYYLFLITWPKNDMRTALVFRSNQLTGPYEGRVALHDAGIAQGGLIDTPKGDWYAYLFQDHGAVGRVPFLVPVKWEDGWPILGVNGRAPETLDIPAGKGGVSGIVASDEFNRDQEGAARLPLVWQWNHNPDNRYWSLTQRRGNLRLTTGRTDADFLQARNTLTQRTFGPECSGSIAMDVSHMKDGDFAGLAALQKNYGFVGVKMSEASRSIVVVNAKSPTPAEVESVPLTQGTVFLKLEIDYRNRADKAYFYYSLDGATWKAIGKPLQITYTLPHFMGYRFALFNYATKTAGGFVDFDYFRVTDKMTEKK
jgi:beta-xylosidase